MIDRFWSYVKYDLTTDCWLWTGACNKDGYARFKVGQQNLLAHRVSYSYFVGDIPKNLELDHKCRVRNCVNPHHCEPVTHIENVKRSVRKPLNKTHCPQGHEYNLVNTFVTSKGYKKCRTCDREYRRNKKGMKFSFDF